MCWAQTFVLDEFSHLYCVKHGPVYFRNLKMRVE